MSVLSKKHNFDMVFDSQEVFRLILDATANPSRIAELGRFSEKLYGEYSAFLAAAFTLLDNEVSFHVCGAQDLSNEIKSYTLAAEADVESADFIFVCSTDQIKNAIESAKCGTLPDPHKSATIIVANDDEFIVPLIFSGPGIDGNTKILASQTMVNAITLRDAQNYEYPQGIDLIFVSGKGELLAIPRLTRMEVY